VDAPGERDVLGREGMGMIGNELGERFGEGKEGLIILLCNKLKALTISWRSCTHRF